MTTSDIVNRFICTRAYSSCLEIGTNGPHLSDVHCARRICVSPANASGVDVRLSSDAFFASNTEKFDAIIVDGVHQCNQVLRDIDNALRALNPGGIVIVRNCLPLSENMASPEPHGGEWCGDVYKAFAWYITTSQYLCYTVDAHYGCGVIDTACKAEGGHDSVSSAFDSASISYSEFDANRVGLLRVISVDSLPEHVVRSVIRKEYAGVRPLYVVTPTGDRPEGFAMCVDYVNRQTRRPDMWIIVDDGRTDAVESQLPRINVPYRVIRLPAIEGENTLLRNLGAAFAHVPDDACMLVVEDDDWYPANYLETAYRLLLKHDFVSISECHYYHVPTRQYRFMHGTPTNGDGWSGPAIPAIRAWVASGIAPLFDNKFGSFWCGTKAVHDAIPGHTVGFGTGRAGVTSSHRIGVDEQGWTSDPDGVKLVEWVGSDAWRYLGDGKKVYVITNVDYPEDARLNVNVDDLLVFLNTARSLDYYDGHENRIVYHRSPKPQYGDERLCVKNRYVFDAGMLSIPEDFLRGLRAEYDWDYPIEDGEVRSATTGYIVAKYMEHEYPDREVVLVNFGYSVAKSTYRCPWHNWQFEAYALSKFRHIFTAAVHSAEDGNAVPYEPKKTRTADEQRVATIFTRAGSDRMTSHDYAEVFTPQVLRLSGRVSRIAEVGGLRGSGVRAFMKALPQASVYGVGVKRSDVVDGSVSVFGDGYGQDAWANLPNDFDLIVDDGTHQLTDMLRGIPVFLSHLADGGVLMIEDISSEIDVDILLRKLPGAQCYRTARISSHGDDRIVVYTKPVSA